MTKNVDKLAKEIHDLPNVEKLRLVDAILTALDNPDPENRQGVGGGGAQALGGIQGQAPDRL